MRFHTYITLGLLLILQFGAAGTTQLQTSLRTAPVTALNDTGVAGASVYLIFMDDVGMGMLPAYTDPAEAFNPGSPENATVTPNIDTFAASAMRFTRASTDPVCGPTKCQVQSGMGTYRSQCYGVGNGTQLSNDNRLLAEATPGWAAAYGKLPATCTEATYGTACTVGVDDQKYLQGWDIARGLFTNTIGNYDSPTIEEHIASPPSETPYATSQHDTVRWRVDSVAAIQAQTGQSFFWLHAHDAHQDFHYYPDGAPWDGADCDINGTPAPHSNADCQQSQVEHLDAEIGLILAEIDTTQDYVILVSDDGTDYNSTTDNIVPAPFNTNWYDVAKGYPGDAGNLVPFFVAGPGIEGGAVRDDLIAFEDLYPTILAMMGRGIPSGLDDGEVNTITIDGKNILPLLKGDTAPQRRFILTGSGLETGTWSVRDNRTPWTLVHDPKVYNAGGLTVDYQYSITTTGTTDFTLIGAADSNPGTIFTATGVGAGTGTATLYPIHRFFFAPAFLAGDTIDSGTTYDYLFELYETQVNNITRDQQLFCYDGADGGPTAIVCEDFEVEVFSACDEETTIDVMVSGPPNSACSSLISPLSGTRDMLLTANNDAFEWHDLETVCTGTGKCYADFLWKTAVNNNNKKLLIFRDDTDTYDACAATFNLAGEAVTVATNSPGGTNVAGVYAYDTEVKLRFEFDNATARCSLYIDPVSGTYGTGATSVAYEVMQTPVAEAISQFHIVGPIGIGDLKADNLAIVGHEPIPNGSFDVAIEGLGYHWPQNFELNSTCTELGLTVGSGVNTDNNADCSHTDGCPDGDQCFGVEGLSSWWTNSTPNDCANLTANTCEFEFMFQMAVLTDGPLGWEYYDAADTVQQLSLEYSAANGLILGSAKFTDDNSGWHPEVGVPYRVRVHVIEDGSNDIVRWWVDPAEGANGGGQFVKRQIGPQSMTNLDPQKIWLHNGSSSSSTRYDNLRDRLLP